MLGLEHVACQQCGTVSAVPVDTEACPRCGATALEPVAGERSAAAYFAGAMSPD